MGRWKEVQSSQSFPLPGWGRYTLVHLVHFTFATPGTPIDLVYLPFVTQHGTIQFFLGNVFHLKGFSVLVSPFSFSPLNAKN